MKFVLIFTLTVLSLCMCNRDKTIPPEKYNGEYPYIKSSKEQLPIYQPVFTSSWQGPPTTEKPKPILAEGQYSLQFKNHEWNHWPYIQVDLIKYSKTPTVYQNIGDNVFGIGFSAMNGYECAMESVGCAIPAQVGHYRFGQEVDYKPDMPFFYTTDCDAPKDNIEVDKSANNWVTITRLDTVSNQIRGSFDLSFIIVRKDITYSIVYPSQFRIRGTFDGLFKKR